MTPEPEAPADPVAFLKSLPPRKQAKAVRLLGEEPLDGLDNAWPGWAHRGQRPPATTPDGADWSTWVIMAGRGFGKTLAGAKWVTEAIAARQPLRIALVGATLEDARRVMVEGPSGLIEVAGAWLAEWHPSLHRLRFVTGAEATLFSGASPGQLRGPEHHLAWCDELAKWEKPQESWDMLQLGLRLGEHPRAIVTTTPRPGPVLKGIMADPATVTTRGSTRANPHTPAAYKRRVHALYAGTRLGRQELDGELLTDTPGALWTVELLEKCRLKIPSPLAGEGDSQAAACERGEGCPGTTFTRTLVAIDPPTGAGTCGIIACAKDSAGIAHVLADHSVTGLSPEGWAIAVASAARIHSLNPPRNGDGDHLKGGGGVPAPLPLIVAEQNQGGKMVAAVLRTADPSLKVKLVNATAGKVDRATPVAHLFEAGKVVLHGRFPELESQLLGLIAGGTYDGPGPSPDRADAMVWGITELMLEKERGEPRIFTF